MSVFTSAVTGKDGTVDPGYLALFWSMAVTVSMVPVVAAFCMIMAAKYPDKADVILGSLAMVVGALGAQSAAVIGAVGLFRAGDKSAYHPVPVAPAPPVEVEIEGAPKVHGPVAGKVK